MHSERADTRIARLRVAKLVWPPELGGKTPQGFRATNIRKRTMVGGGAQGRSGVLRHRGGDREQGKPEERSEI